MSSARIDVPIKTYKSDRNWIMADILADWLKEIGLDYRFAGGDLWADPLNPNPSTTAKNFFVVEGIQEADCLAFKIRFPDCNVRFLKDT